MPNDANPCDLGSTCSINDHCGGGQCIGDAVAAPDCLQPIDAGSPFRMQDAEDDARDALAWKWHKGQETKLGDFGDPVDGSGDYELCVFDQPEGVLRLQLSVSVPKGGVCDDKPCWKLRGTKGYAYKDRQASKGIKTIILKAGVDGKAKVLVKGKGAELGMAALPLADPGANPVRVQLKDAGTGRCWEALYGEAIQNDTTRFKAKY